MRGGRLLALPALLIVSLVAASALAKEAVWPSGLYSNVHSIEETGDILGMEARFFEDAGRHMVEFVWCEGWCNETFTVPVSRTPDGFAFSYFQRFADGGVDAGQTMRFLAWPEGRVLKISAWQGSEKLDRDGRPQRLRRATKLSGIAMARSGN